MHTKFESIFSTLVSGPMRCPFSSLIMIMIFARYLPHGRVYPQWKGSRGHYDLDQIFLPKMMIHAGLVSRHSRPRGRGNSELCSRGTEYCAQRRKRTTNPLE